MRSAIVGGPSAVARIAGVLLLMVALGAWALASPVGSSPDEDYHLASTWCAQGPVDGRCETGGDEATRRVPVAVLEANCYVFQPAESAACQGDDLVEYESTLEDSPRGNFQGDYPPVFYWVSSLFLGDDVASSVLAMRMAHVVLLTLVTVAVSVASPRGLRRALLVGLAVTAVPLGMFLVPSVNPSAWALLSPGLLLVSVAGYLVARDPARRVALAVLAALALLLGAGSRGDAALYAVVAIGAAGILAFRPDRAYLWRLAYPALLAVVALGAFASTGQSGAVAATAPEPLTPALLFELLVTVPDLWIGALGSWDLGWFDTAMPSLVWVLTGGTFAATLFTALAGADGRRGLATAAVAAGVWVVPTYIQYLSGMPVGAQVQPRYILPLLTLLPLTAMVRLDGDAFRLTSGQRWLVVGALSLANAVALHTNIRRYVTGNDLDAVNLDVAVEWWWGSGPSPMAVWFVGGSAFAIGLALLSGGMTTRRPAASPRPGSGVPAGARSDAAPPAPPLPPGPRASSPDGPPPSVAPPSAAAATRSPSGPPPAYHRPRSPADRPRAPGRRAAEPGPPPSAAAASPRRPGPTER